VFSGILVKMTIVRNVAACLIQPRGSVQNQGLLTEALTFMVLFLLAFSVSDFGRARQGVGG